MKSLAVFILVAMFLVIPTVYAQEVEVDNEVVLTQDELLLLFGVSILFVAGISIYLTRDLILRKKLDYDKEKLQSQENRDFEKYHSDWNSEEPQFGGKSKKFNEEFRKELEESNVPEYYKILGVDKTATQDQIKKKYRELAKEKHPDKSKDEDTEEVMVEINKAYEILSDPKLKKQYDNYLNPPKN